MLPRYFEIGSEGVQPLAGQRAYFIHIRRRTPLRLTRWLWVVKRCHHSALAVIGPGQILPIDLRHDGVVRIVDHGRAGGKPGSTRPPPAGIAAYRGVGF